MKSIQRLRARISPVMLGLVTAGLIVIGSVRAAEPGQSAPAEPTGDAARGRGLFKNYGCFACHGTEGQGASTGPKLAPVPLPLLPFLILVRHPANVMPPYSEKVLPEHDLRDIHAFLESVTAPNPDALARLSRLKTK